MSVVWGPCQEPQHRWKRVCSVGTFASARFTASTRLRVKAR